MIRNIQGVKKIIWRKLQIPSKQSDLPFSLNEQFIGD